jgi:hypothetical protein
MDAAPIAAWQHRAFLAGPRAREELRTQ